MTEARSEERKAVALPVVAYPVLDDGWIDLDHPMDGESVDVSPNGMRVDLDEVPAGCQALCVGVEPSPGGKRFAGVAIRHAESLDGRQMIGGRIREVLAGGRSAPSLDSATLALRHRLPEEGFERLERRGIVRKTFLDRVLVCPRCHALPTIRKGCRHCGSGRVSSERHIHHFACGHYGPAAAFEKPGGLTCPRCRQRSLVVGADYEFAEGAHLCSDCGWSDSSFETIGHCLRCSHRFPESELFEKDLYLYEIERLEPRDLLREGAPCSVASTTG